MYAARRFILWAWHHYDRLSHKNYFYISFVFYNTVVLGPGGASESFSSRELQVLRMIAKGGSVGQVAEEISLSVKTVSTYRSRILKKAKLTNNSELMRYVWSQNLT